MLVVGILVEWGDRNLMSIAAPFNISFKSLKKVSLQAFRWLSCIDKQPFKPPLMNRYEILMSEWGNYYYYYFRLE